MAKKKNKKKNKSKQIDKQREYQQYVNSKLPKINYVKNCVWAFMVGGLICTIAQWVFNILKDFGVKEDEAATFTVIIMILASAILTGVGIYDKIGKRAGAGSIVPITGFANSVVAPAMEFKREGYVMGVGAKMFSMAGPVLVYGFGSSVMVGLIYYFIGK